MKRTTISVLAVVLALGAALIPLAAEDKKANELLEAALTKETIEGDLKGAIILYEQAGKEAGSNRQLAAKAQLRLAAAHQKQGNEAARTIYERVAREYGDLTDLAAEAQTRLNALRPTGIGAAMASGKTIMQPPDIPFIISPGTQPANAGPIPRQITLFDRQGKVVGTDPKRDPTVPLERWKISGDASVAVAGVRWRADGKEMYYLDVNGGFNAVTVTSNPTFKASAPRVLFQVPKTYQTANNSAGLSDVTADGQIFVLSVPVN